MNILSAAVIVCFFSTNAWARGEPDRNVLSFSPARGFLGTINGLYSYAAEPNALYAYVGQPLGYGMDMNKGISTWSTIKSTDGITWTEIDQGFIDTRQPTERGGVIETNSVSSGTGIATFPAKLQSRIVLAIRGIFSPLRTISDLDTSVPAENGGTSSPTPIRVGTDVYVAYLSVALDTCSLKFSRLTATNHLLPPQAILLGVRRCRALSIIQMPTTDYLIAFAASDGDDDIPRPSYFFASLTSNAAGLSFSMNGEIRSVNAGHDAHDFNFVRWNGATYMLGWFANREHASYYPGSQNTPWKNHLTVMRKVTNESGNLRQDPIDLTVRGSIQKPLKTGSAGKAGASGLCEDFRKNLKTDVDGAYQFQLQISHKGADNKDYSGGGYDVTFKGSHSQSVTFSMYGSGTDIIYAVDRTNTILTTTDNRAMPPVASGRFRHGQILGNATVLLDKSSIEVFFEAGKYVISENFFLTAGNTLDQMCVKTRTSGEAKVISSLGLKVTSIFETHDGKLGSGHQFHPVLLLVAVSLITIFQRLE